MDDAEFHKRLDATITGEPDEDGNLPFASLLESHAVFHDMPVPGTAPSPGVIARWFAGYDRLYDSSLEDKPGVVGLMRPSHFSLDPWTRAVGDSLNRLMVREYEADADPSRDWNKHDVEIRKGSLYWEHFTSPQGGLVIVAPEKGKFSVCERVPPERINGYDIDPLRGLPARLAQRFKQRQFEILRDLAGSVEAMSNCKFGVAVELTEKPRLRIQVTEEIIFVAMGYFGAAVIA